MIHNRIDDSSGPALLVRQARELPIGVVENVRDNVKNETDEVKKKRAVEVKMAGDDSENATDESDSCRREFEVGKELGYAKADFAVKEKIGNSFQLARFIGGRDAVTP